MTSERRSVSLTGTGPHAVVIEIQLSGPEGTLPDALRTRLDVAVRHVVDVFATGVPVDVDVGELWIRGVPSGRGPNRPSSCHQDF